MSTKSDNHPRQGDTRYGYNIWSRGGHSQCDSSTKYIIFTTHFDLPATELLLLAILLLSLLYDVVLYVSSYITITAMRIKVTDTQKKLLGVQKKGSRLLAIL